MLVHGSRLAHTQWAPQLSRIAADPTVDGWLKVLAPDLPGHGERAAEPFTLERAVGAVAAAVEGPSARAERVVLAGHSLGGFVAATYAATFPGRLDGLVLLGAAARPRGAGSVAYRSVAALTERLGPGRMTRVNDFVLGRLYPPDVVDSVVAGGYWFAPTRAAWGEVMSRCGPRQLREVTCPVLIAGGAFDQLMVDARRYARAAPRARVHRVPRAGHFVGLDRPEEVTQLLLGFVRAVAEERDPLG